MTEIPRGLCQCGCGAPTTLAKRDDPTRGVVKGKPLNYLPGHHARRVVAPPEGYVVDATTGCWNWLLGRTNCGYGRMWHQGAKRFAHRHLWEQRNGPIPDGLELDHLCRNRACVNPAHMEPVTHLENVRRSAVSKLTAEQVLAIRASDESGRALARRYGVGEGAISSVRVGRNWKDLPEAA